jgi:hypothetical protein
MLACPTIVMIGTSLSTFMTTPWHAFQTWGLMVGIGSGAGAVGFAGTIANRWFIRRAGLAMGLLTAACLMATVLVLRIAPRGTAIAAAE